MVKPVNACVLRSHVGLTQQNSLFQLLIGGFTRTKRIVNVLPKPGEIHFKLKIS